MSGGIAQLVAIGAQDAHLVGQPEVSFFRSNYKRHTNFAQTVERQTIQGNPSDNGMSTVRFERKGDMLGYVYLTPVGSDGAAQEFSAADLAAQIDKVELLIGGQVIDTQDSTFSMDLAPTTMSQNLTKSTTGFAGKSGKFYPLRFSFCENAQSALPLVALQYHDVEVRISWGTINGDSSRWECFSQFIHLDTDERTTLSSTPQNMIITQTQKAIASGGRIQELSFNHPMKYLVAKTTGSSDLTSAGNKIKLQINGTDVTNFKDADPHFTAIPTYYHTQSSVSAANGHNVATLLVPFCIDTSKLQPTGSLNFSRLDSARIVSDTQNNGSDIYGVNYNVLRIENGMGGLMYSN